MSFKRAVKNSIENYLHIAHRTAPDVPSKVFIQPDGLFTEYSTDEPLHNLLNGFYSTQNFISLFYSVPEVFAPVHEIAKRVSDAVWELRRDWNDEVDYNDADFNRLFTQPNPLISHKDLVYQSVCYEILTGKSLQYKNQPKTLTLDGYRSVVTWSNLPAHQIFVEMNKTTDPYTATTIADYVRSYKQGQRSFDVNNVIPIVHLGLDGCHDLNKCMPLIIGGEKAIRNLIPVYEARGVIYIKRGALGFLVSKKSDETGMVALTKDEKKEASEEAQMSYGLQRNKSQVGVSSAPVEFVRTSMSIQELQPFDETLADAVAIYAALRVPRHLVPSKDQSTFSNAAADMRSFYSDTIIPWAERYAQIWNNWFDLKSLRRYIKPNFNHVDALQENRKDKADYTKTEGSTWLERWQNGACSLNDWIVAIGNKAVTGNPLYEKKIFELTPEELTQIKDIIHGNKNASPKDTAGQGKGAANK